MKTLRTICIVGVFALFISNGFSQSLSVSSGISVDELPEYVIVTSQNTKLLGGISIMIDSKKSSYQDQLEELQSLLQSARKLHVRNQTDLLNAMSKLGYDFVDAYNASQVTTQPLSNGNKDTDALNALGSAISGGEGTFRVNMIFRKKAKYRQ